MRTLRQVAEGRKKSQGGQEIIEFGLTALLLIPLLLGSVVTGMGLIRSMQAQQVCRDLASIYIHGGDFSTYPLQQLAQRLARGLNLQIGNSFAGYNRQNTSNGGDVVVTVSQIFYVGGLTGPTCAAVGASRCVNHDSFVYTQWIRFGNGSIASQNTVGLESPSTSGISASGVISDPYTDSGARVPTTSQTKLQTQWLGSGGGRTPLVDGQVMYTVEFYLQAPGVSIGNASVGGAYARYYY